MVLIPTGGYKLDTALDFDTSYRPLSTFPNPPEFTPEDIYVFSMDRVGSLLSMLGSALYLSAQGGRVTGFVPCVTGLAHEDALLADPKLDQDAFNRRLANYGEYAESVDRLPLKRFGGLPDTPNRRAEAFATKMGLAEIDYLASFIGGRNSQICAGIEGVLYSMILGAYVAFEALVTALWTSALDKNPSAFRTHQVGCSNPKNAVWRVEALSQPSPGEYLRKRANVRFGSDQGILDAFGESFGYRSNVYKVLDPNDAVWDVEEVRHLIAHRSGFVDQKFKDEIRTFSRLSSAPLNQPLEIDGEITRDLINACVKTSVSLIRAVRAWEQTNGPSTM